VNSRIHCLILLCVAAAVKLQQTVIGISSDSDQADFKGKFNLGMTLLSDAGGKVRKAFNVPRR
jgi:peroxiredoxin